MRQKSLITLVSVLALFLGGCPANDDEAPTAQSTPVPVAKRVSRKPKVTATPFAAKPLAAGQPAKATAAADLTQTLPPEARVNQIRKNLGRNDPFAGIPTQPVVVERTTTTTPGTTGRPVPVIPQLPPPRRNTGGGNQPAKTPATPTRITQRPRTVPNVLPPVSRLPKPTTNRQQNPNRSGIIPLPPLAVGPRELPNLPEPTLAKTIEVTGVVDTGGVPSAIVKVPNEPARSVREGERLSNGQVLVKRIEVNRGPTPVVILEQFGQEVARQVGDKSNGTPGQPGVPTALRENLNQGIKKA